MLLLKEWLVWKQDWQWNGMKIVSASTTLKELEVSLFFPLHFKTFIPPPPSPSLSVTLYSCDRLGTNCAQCLAIPSSYGCGFCSSPSKFSCPLHNQCSSQEDIVDDVGKCPLPTIETVSFNLFITTFSPMCPENHVNISDACPKQSVTEVC